VSAAASSVGTHRDHDLFGHRPRRDTSGPAHDRWNAKAAFEQFLLHAGERLRLREPLAAVVTGEDHNGVICEAGRIERLQHSANIHVQALYHVGIGLLCAAVAMKDVPDALGLGFIIWSFPRPMRRAVKCRLMRNGCFDLA